jgi:hypothetical protein
MNVMKPDSFLNVSEMDSEKALVVMIDRVVSGIRTTELENKTKSVQLVSLNGSVLEFFSAIPGENTTTPKGPKLSKDEVIELLGNDEILSAVYDHIVAEYQGCVVCLWGRNFRYKHIRTSQSLIRLE